ncbi:MAG: efflux RND transporter periplasmic adaptor subunit [Panacibacter sp.]
MANNGISEDATKIVTQKNEGVAVPIDTVKNELLQQSFTANGNFAPSQELSFAAEKAGRVVKVFVKEGDYVHIGQTLATIRTEQLNVSLQNANAAYQNAVADYQRYQNAFATGGVTKQQVEQSKLSLNNAAAQLKQSQINMGDANIHATINGIVNKKYIEPGSVLSPGSPIIDLVNVATLKLKITVNEAQVATLKLGDVLPVTASVYPDKKFSGKVTFIAPKADNTLNFPVELQIANNTGNSLKAGMYGTAVFEAPNEKPVLTVSRKAFAGSVSSNQVFVIDNNKTAHVRAVTSGRVLGDKVEILNGLQQGEIVITSGQINLTEGSKVVEIK